MFNLGRVIVVLIPFYWEKRGETSVCKIGFIRNKYSGVLEFPHRAVLQNIVYHKESGYDTIINKLNDGLTTELSRGLLDELGYFFVHGKTYIQVYALELPYTPKENPGSCFTFKEMDNISPKSQSVIAFTAIKELESLLNSRANLNKTYN